jgi:hypothetical protein
MKGRAGPMIALLLTASAADAQVLVVRATGPSAGRYKAGMALPPTAKVTLKQGDLLVLLDERSSWTLRGPGTLPVQARQTAVAAPRLMSVDERRARIGAVRTPDADALTRPNLWLIDVAQSGPACIVDAKAPQLWRADEKAAGRTTVSGPAGASGIVDWSPGQEIAAWPAGVPIVPGGVYHLSGPGNASVTLKPLASPPDSVADAGKALIANGCTAQLDLLVAQMAAAGKAGGS